MFTKSFVVLLFSLVSKCYCLKKTWIPNTNFLNPNNWLGNELPSHSDRVVFPLDLQTAVSFAKYIAVGEMDLPRDGELLFLNGGFGITGKTSGKAVQFKNQKLQPWLNPLNWKSSAGINRATPHSEMVPCIFDDVEFPDKSSFWVQYPEVPVRIKSIKITGQNMSKDEWNAFLLSDVGDRQFRQWDYQDRLSVINIEGGTCTEQSGCVCHSSSETVDMVCTNVKCPVPYCTNPVKPVGHCCPICGAYLIVGYDAERFKISKFKSVVLNHVLSTEKAVDVYVHKIVYQEDTHIQVILAEEGEYEETSADIADQLQKKFKSNLRLYNLLSSVEFHSGIAFLPGSVAGSVAAVVLGTLFAVLFALGLLYFIYESPQRHKLGFRLPFNLQPTPVQHQFVFARFENKEDGQESLAGSILALDKTFDNPLYNQPGPSSKDPEEIQGGMVQQTEILHANPVFSKLKEQEHDEEEV